MQSNKKYDFSIPLYYFFFFGGQCLIVSYMNLYLENHLHFSGSELGLFTSITPLVPAAIIPLVGIICDKTRRYKEIFLGFLGLAIASAAVMSVQTLLPLVLLVGILFETARTSCISLSDVQTTEYCAFSGKNYGFFRIGGSVGWVVCGVLVGFLTSRIPLDTLLFPAYILTAVFTFLFALLFPNIRKLNPAASSREKTQNSAAAKNPLKTLLHNKPYVAMLFVTVVVSLAGDVSLSYAGNHLVSTMGSPASIIGLNTAFSVVPEFFFFPAIAWLLKKYGFKKMYLLSAIGVTLRFSIYFLADSPYVFLLGSLLHCLGSGCFTAVDLAFIHKKVDPSIFGTAVTLFGTVSTIAKAFYGYLYGFIYQNFGSRYIYLSIIPLGVLVIIYLLRTRIFDEKPSVSVF